MTRNIIQKFSAILLCVYCASVAAQSSKNAYLPPDEGYHYDAPSVSFQNPQQAYRPPPPPPAPSVSFQNPQQAYRPPPPPPAPRPRPISPPLDQSGSAISPVGQEGAGLGGGEFDHLRQPHVPGMPFDFQYAVKDDFYGTDYGHSASSNGDQVRGEYRTQLPDGRLQIVKYIADWKDGYTAEVTYQGEAQYPQGVPGSSGSNIAGVGYRPNPSASYPSSSQPSSAYPSPYPSPYPSSPKPFPSRPAFSGSGYSPVQQPGPAILSYPGSVSSPRPIGSASYGQQSASGFGGSQSISGYGGSQSASGYGGSQQQVSGYGGSQQTVSGYGGSQLVSGYGGSQQTVTGYGGSSPQPSSIGYQSSSPAPSYSSTSDYGSYKK